MEASADMKRWLSLDQSGVFGLDKSLQQVSSKVLKNCPAIKTQTGTLFKFSLQSECIMSQTWILQKCEFAKPGEFWESILPSYDRQQPRFWVKRPKTVEYTLLQCVFTSRTEHLSYVAHTLMVVPGCHTNVSCPISSCKLQLPLQVDIGGR